MNQRTLPLLGKYRLGWIIFWFSVIIMVNGLVLGLDNSIRGLSTGRLVLMGMIAIILGWVMAGFNRHKIFIFVCGILMGLLLPLLFDSGAYVYLIRSYLRFLHDQFSGYDPQQFSVNVREGIYFLYAAILEILNYVQAISRWTTRLVQGENRFDPVAVNFIWGTFAWTAIFSSGWLFRIKQYAFTSTLPILGLLVSVIGYSRRNTNGLIIVSSTILIMMVLLEHLKREISWNDNNIDFSEELRFDITTLAIPVIIIIMVIASVIPNISLSEIRSFIDETFRAEHQNGSTLPESFGLEQPPSRPFSQAQPRGMPRSHLIGSGSELSEILIMEVDTGEIFLPPQVDPTFRLPKYYWFGQSFDIYTGLGWETSEIRTEDIPTGQVIHPPLDPDQDLKTFTFIKSEVASETLYSPGIPHTVDRDITAAWRVHTGEYFSAELRDQNYQVETQIQNWRLDELQMADLSPPDEILATYLQLPDDVPSRVIDLALQITDPEASNYQNARLIEAYLRQFEYSLDLPSPPQDRDIVDYFLFDLQKGYCDYYASAMVVLARAVGIPARFAVGYATGGYDYITNHFVVTEANAHAWVEIYFEAYGWIPFEPTASLSSFTWGVENESGVLPVEPHPLEIQHAEEVSDWLNWVGVIGFLIIIILVFLIWRWINRHTHKTSSHLIQIEDIYQNARKQLIKSGYEPQTAKTPSEYLQEFIEYFSKTKPHPKTRTYFETTSEALTDIIRIYELGVYAARELRHEQLIAARNNLRKLRLQVFLLNLSTHLRGS